MVNIRRGKYFFSLAGLHDKRALRRDIRRPAGEYLFVLHHADILPYRITARPVKREQFFRAAARGQKAHETGKTVEKCHQQLPSGELPPAFDTDGGGNSGYIVGYVGGFHINVDADSSNRVIYPVRLA